MEQIEPNTLLAAASTFLGVAGPVKWPRLVQVMVDHFEADEEHPVRQGLRELVYDGWLVYDGRTGAVSLSELVGEARCAP